MQEEARKNFEDSIKELAEMKDKVEHFILLAVTEDGEGNQRKGLNCIGGSLKGLINLLENLDPELMRMYINYKAVTALVKEEKENGDS